MPPKRGTKRKTSADAEQPSDASTGQSVRSEPKHPARHSRGKRLSRLEKYDEEEGRDRGRDVQQWGDWLQRINREEATKSKAELKSFVQKLDSQHQQMSAFIEKQDETLNQRNHQSKAVFEKVYSKVVPPASVVTSASKKPKGTSKEEFVLFQQAQDIIRSSRSLLHWYKETDDNLKTHQLDLPTATWKKDKQDIKEILICGREHGEKIIEGNLAPDNYSPPEGSKSKANGHEQAAIGLFDESRKTVGGDDCWGSVANEQIKKLKGLADTLAPKRESMLSAGKSKYTGDKLAK
ncbi:hypothetical protein BJ170DRAFT_685820 [Xylariales sp. AK1849]|nr:hypothetical protein BJ170DRAFT_685820 [Xylariales sp. AK1849]